MVFSTDGTGDGEITFPDHSIGVNEIDLSMAPTWTGTHTFDDIVIDGVLDIGTVETFTDSYATHDVSTGSYWNTNTTAVTITDFDGA